MYAIELCDNLSIDGHLPGCRSAQLGLSQTSDPCGGPGTVGCSTHSKKILRESGENPQLPILLSSHVHQ